MAPVVPILNDGRQESRLVLQALWCVAGWLPGARRVTCVNPDARCHHQYFDSHAEITICYVYNSCVGHLTAKAQDSGLHSPVEVLDRPTGFLQ
ncbi:hypothetical protein PGT21_001704 [Puccinia graminis f. sp. tritici]|uniref:Uncharacterized protein n=1 Tax=Puccinia graminis f. sp. tritici TaxID=56615 RepID=A0A5B0MTJ2_PUCGR|nr:hypothetical protein PGTUg99_009317 [Puccinia graminis f. sp. tritici]KAA1080305.1 hypothetical protein PGT21_001704 [Puccinia graminis f. sp. tritici]KAA1122635.1 hypothetical protein PGTUg99_000393 [Puccinia graminis f. sp. tritici]